MNLTTILNKRYSTKEFDPERKISAEDVQQIKDLLRFSPSSTNMQPWHFIIADDEAGKGRMSKGTQDFFKFNASKVNNASHVVLFASRVELPETHFNTVLDREDKYGRHATPENKANMDKSRKYFADIHRYDLKDIAHWNEKQTYLAMGFLLLGVAALGIDAVPMEGVDVKALDEEFGLREKGYTALALVSLGYHKDSDFNSKLPKSRLPESEVITVL